MRRVKVSKQELREIEGRIEGRADFVKVPNGEAWFHQWGVDWEEFENGAASYSTAIIERDDGTVETPPANMIKFMD